MGRFGYPSPTPGAADPSASDTFTDMTPSEVTGGTSSAAAEGAPSTAGYHATLDQVALIARHAAGAGEPERVSRRAFDRARRELDLADAVPTPQGLEHRLGQKFADILRQALSPVSARVAMIGPDQSSQVQADFPDRLMVLALKSCHRALDQVPAPADYNAWAAEFERERRRAGRAPNPLPHSTRFIGRYGSWPDALVAAEIIESVGENELGASQFAPPPPLAETISTCIDELGVLPTGSLLMKWAKRRDIAVSRADGRNVKAAVEQCRLLRAAEGKWTPEKATPANKAPSLDDLPDLPAAPHGRRKGEGWTLDELLACVREYLDQAVPAGQPPRQQTYRAYCKKVRATGRRFPAASTLQGARDEQGEPIGFQDLCRLAEASR